ncbi:MAG: hypothetical protein RXR06_07930 [Thermoproteus sp.]
MGYCIKKKKGKLFSVEDILCLYELDGGLSLRREVWAGFRRPGSYLSSEVVYLSYIGRLYIYKYNAVRDRMEAYVEVKFLEEQAMRTLADEIRAVRGFGDFSVLLQQLLSKYCQGAAEGYVVVKAQCGKRPL